MNLKTHWKKLTNPNYLGAYAFEENKDIILTIKSVGNEVITGEGGRKEECTVCHFVENYKPMILNKTNSSGECLSYLFYFLNFLQY